MVFKFIRKVLVVIFFASILPTLTSVAEGADNPVARVNDTALTEVDLSEEINILVPTISMHGGISSERLAKYRPQAIENMIESELLYQGAQEMGLEVDRKRVNNAIKELKEKMGGGKRFKMSLKVRGLTEKKYKKMLERRFLIEKIIDQEITQKSKVTEEEALEHYQKFKNSYMRPEARRISHIMISVPANAMPDEWENKRKRAESVREKAVQGEDFSTLAWDYSDDSYKFKGGDLGLLHKGRLDPALETEIDKLEVGEISPVIQTIYGYHILKVNEKVSATQLSFEEVSQKIIGELTEKRKKRLEEALLSGLKEKADIEIYE